jgi:hypothetical protein
MTGDLTARAKIRQLPGRVTIGVQHMQGMTGTLDVIGRQASRRAAAHDD